MAKKNRERVHDEPNRANVTPRREKQAPKAEKEVFIEDIDKKSGELAKKEPEKDVVVDIDGDGNVGNLDTEITKMQNELEKIEDELQAISDEDGLEMISELRSLLGSMKVGGIANIRELINQARQLKGDIQIELTTAMKTTPEGKERSKELEDELMKLLKELEKRSDEYGLDNDKGNKLISKLKQIDIKDIQEDPVKVGEMIRNTRELLRTKEKEHSLIATIGTVLKAVFRDRENPKLGKDNKPIEKDREKDIPTKTIADKKQKEKEKSIDNKGRSIETKGERGLKDEYELSQNNELIGIIKELANSGDTKKLKEVFENHKDELQLNDYAKALDKPVKVGMSVENYKWK